MLKYQCSMKPRLILILSLLMAGAHCTFGLFMSRETELVPIDRLFKNLEKRQKESPDDFRTTYYLARLHAMAYSTNLTKLQATKADGDPVFEYPGYDSGVPRKVHKGVSPKARIFAEQHLTNAIAHYKTAIGLLKKSADLDEKKWMIIPTQLGYAWCLEQAAQREDALKEYRKVLKMAWKQEVTGDFDLKEWLQDSWDDVKSGNNPLKGTSGRGFIGPGVCYSEEIIGYMLKLLDPVADAKEIAELKGKKKELAQMSRAITPILIPMNSQVELNELVNPEANVLFDLDGSGISKKWGWITTNAAWLVYDKQGVGQITSGLQMMGNVTFWIFWENGYQPLAALDDNGDGVISGNELKGFALWQDQNANGISETGEVRPVGEFGIRSISTKHEVHESGIPWSPQGVTLKDGTILPSYDWIVPGKN